MVVVDHSPADGRGKKDKKRPGEGQKHGGQGRALLLPGKGERQENSRGAKSRRTVKNGGPGERWPGAFEMPEGDPACGRRQKKKNDGGTEQSGPDVFPDSFPERGNQFGRTGQKGQRKGKMDDEWMNHCRQGLAPFKECPPENP